MNGGVAFKATPLFTWLVEIKRLMMKKICEFYELFIILQRFSVLSHVYGEA